MSLPSFVMFFELVVVFLMLSIIKFITPLVFPLVLIIFLMLVVFILGLFEMVLLFMRRMGLLYPSLLLVRHSLLQRLLLVVDFLDDFLRVSVRFLTLVRLCLVRLCLVRLFLHFTAVLPRLFYILSVFLQAKVIIDL